MTRKQNPKNISPGAYVIKKSPVGILWSKQATSLDILFEP